MCLEQKYILLRLHCYLWKASKIWKEINIWQLADVSENTAVHRHQPCALLSLDRDSLYSTERKPGACFVIASHLGSSDVQSWTQSAPLPPQIKANERLHFTTDSRCRYMTSFCRRTQASTTVEVFWQGCPFGISIFSPWLSFGVISIETPPSAKILSGQLSEERRGSFNGFCCKVYDSFRQSVKNIVMRSPRLNLCRQHL